MTTENEPAQPAQKPSNTNEPQTFSREYVSELREEAKKYRLHLEEARKAEKLAADQAAEATKAASAKIAEAHTAAEARIIRAELKAHAVKAGMVDLDALKMLDLSVVKLSDDGELEGADALFEAAKKAKPYLFGTVSTSSTAPVPKPSPAAEKSYSEMTPAEQAAFKRKLGIRLV